MNVTSVTRRRIAALIASVSMITLWGASALVAAAPGAFGEGAPAVLTESEALGSGCSRAIERFRQTLVWYDSGNRLLVEARSACGSGYSDLLDLEDVTLTLLEGGRIHSVLHASQGTLSLSRSILMIGQAEAPAGVQEGCIRVTERLIIDLKTGSLRMPGKALNLAKRGSLRECRIGAGSP